MRSLLRKFSGFSWDFCALIGHFFGLQDRCQHFGFHAPSPHRWLIIAASRNCYDLTWLHLASIREILVVCTSAAVVQTGVDKYFSYRCSGVSAVRGYTAPVRSFGVRPAVLKPSALLTYFT